MYVISLPYTVKAISEQSLCVVVFEILFLKSSEKCVGTVERESKANLSTLQGLLLRYLVGRIGHLSCRFSTSKSKRNLLQLNMIQMYSSCALSQVLHHLQ